MTCLVLEYPNYDGFVELWIVCGYKTNTCTPVISSQASNFFNIKIPSFVFMHRAHDGPYGSIWLLQIIMGTQFNSVDLAMTNLRKENIKCNIWTKYPYSWFLFTGSHKIAGKIIMNAML